MTAKNVDYRWYGRPRLVLAVRAPRRGRGRLCPGAREAAQIKIPEPGVPQIMTMEGRYVRAAYNNEGYVILGYQRRQPVGRRGVDAARGRHDRSRRSAETTR